MPALSWVNNEERFYDFECACTVPYPGRLGVVEEGALADLLMVDGNPLENLNLVGDPGRYFNLIMKDGTIYKNTLH